MRKHELGHILDTKAYFHANIGCVLVQVAEFLKIKTTYNKNPTKPKLTLLSQQCILLRGSFLGFLILAKI